MFLDPYMLYVAIALFIDLGIGIISGAVGILLCGWGHVLHPFWGRVYDWTGDISIFVLMTSVPTIALCFIYAIIRKIVLFS